MYPGAIINKDEKLPESFPIAWPSLSDGKEQNMMEAEDK